MAAYGGISEKMLTTYGSVSDGKGKETNEKGRGTNILDCISCGKCTRACIFLQKYSLNLSELAKRPELFYSCFLCDRCGEVCPVGISGKKIVLEGRLLAAGGKEAGRAAERLPYPGYSGLLWEKDPYRFANYRGIRGGSVLWTGCNFTGFFPKTEKRLRLLFAEHGIGTVHDCCQKPVYELGLSDEADRNLKQIGQRLLQSGVRELIMVCPNCYYFMKEHLPAELKCVTVYRKLAELRLGARISAAGFPIYLPCPDRAARDFLRDLQPFLPEEAETETFAPLQCCGLGGCAAVREPELADALSKQAIHLSKTGASIEKTSADVPLANDAERNGSLYTYCASCVGQFRRKGFYGARHVLPLILGVREDPCGGIRPFLNRVAGTVLMR